MFLFWMRETEPFGGRLCCTDGRCRPGPADEHPVGEHPVDECPGRGAFCWPNLPLAAAALVLTDGRVWLLRRSPLIPRGSSRDARPSAIVAIMMMLMAVDHGDDAPASISILLVLLLYVVMMLESLWMSDTRWTIAIGTIGTAIVIGTIGTVWNPSRMPMPLGYVASFSQFSSPLSL